jgi:uncharacterized protein (UPF0264 family)
MPSKGKGMKVLISPVSLEEAKIVVAGGCDIVDIKNVQEGSLGAQPPWAIQEIVGTFKGHGVLTSAALGDLPNKPGTVALAAYGAAQTGADYLKAGLYGAQNYDDALAMMTGVVRAIRMVDDNILKVACGYADYRRFGGVSPTDTIRAAKAAGADVVMLDTAVKDGKTLFDALSVEELKAFVGAAHEAGMLTALAGSIGTAHMEDLFEIDPDIVGVRGAVCDGSLRTCSITREGVEAFMASVRKN